MPIIGCGVCIVLVVIFLVASYFNYIWLRTIAIISATILWVFVLLKIGFL
jgi:hypothetical protein